MNGQTGASVLGRRVARQPGEGVVLLENKSEHIGGVIGVQGVGVFTVQELI